MRASGATARVAAVAVVVLCALALVALAARSERADTVRPAPGPTAPPSLKPVSDAVKAPDGGQVSDPAADFSGGQMPRGLVVVAALAIVGLAVAASLVFAIAVRPRLELPTLGGGGESPGTGGAPRRADTADGRRLADAAQAALLELERGDPGEGVVACWVLLERAAADAGTHRARPDTPSELAGRLIDRHEVSAAPLLRLAELYREARYSRHVLPEAARDEARAALEQVAAELATRPAGWLRAAP